MIGIPLLFLGLLVGTEAFFTSLSVLNLRHSARAVESEREWLTETQLVEDPDRVLDYQRATHGVGRLQSWVTLGFLLVVLYSGLYGDAAEAVSALGAGPVLEGLVFILGALLAYTGVKLVFGIVRQFVVEEIFGFNEASVADFLKTQAIGIGFSLLVWGVLGTGLLVAIGTMPQLWWIAGTGLFTVVILGMSMLQTRVIIPLMYDTSQIEDGELHDAVTDIFDAAGGRCDAVYSIETSSETSRLNAVVSGIGASKRVFLYDTLVEELEDAEIQAVLAHELGHWQNGHLWKKVCANIAVTALMLAGLWALMQTGWLYDSFGLPQETYVGLLTGAIWLYPVQRLVAPLHNWLSYRHEYEADGFAISLTGDIEANLNALRTLTDENLINPFPHPWYAAFNHAHPPAPERMRHVQDEFEATNQEVQTSGESADTAVANP